MKLTADQLKNLGYVERDGEWVKAGRAVSRAEPQSIVRDESVAASSRKAGDTGRVRVRVISFRARLCDPDNLCPKYFVDCLRYAGLIADDTPEHITIEVAQVKCRRKEERTEIELT